MSRPTPSRLLILVLLGLPFALSGQGVITTIGGGIWSFRGDGGPAANAALGFIGQVTVDSAGNVYAADYGNNFVVKISPGGILNVVAGNGILGFSGDGGPARNASLNYPLGVIVDTAGNVYVADAGNQRIRKVGANGVVTTVAGNGKEGFSGDGGPGIAASLDTPAGLALDAASNLYIVDSLNNRIRRLSPAGIITTVAGDGRCTFSGDGGPATLASLCGPNAVTTDSSGNLFVADTGNRRIRRINASGFISTAVGNGIAGTSGDGGQAIFASLSFPEDVSVDAAGSLYIVDAGGQSIRKVNPSGIISTIAGNGNPGFSGDGGLATSASFNGPSSITLDASGNIYVGDTFNLRVRKIIADGTVNTLAGNGLYKFGGDGGPATQAFLNYPQGLTVDAAGNVYFADTFNQRIRKISPSGIITSVAGNGKVGFSGDGVPGTAASLTLPKSVALDLAGNLYIADATNNRIRKLGLDGTITTAAGNGIGAFSGDGGAALAASLRRPEGVAVDRLGSLYISDTGNNRIRKVTLDGVINTLAGTGVAGFSGDGAAGALAQVNQPCGIVSDGSGVYFADTGNNRVRKIDSRGIITTIAGNGNADFLGDGGLATSAALNGPTGLALDAAANFYVGDTFNRRVRKFTLGGAISTVAGGGLGGDGVLATDALFAPSGVAVDGAGNIYLSDVYTDRIRKVLAQPPAFSVSPATLSFSAASGGAVPVPQQILVSSPVSGLLWNALATTKDGGTWLSASPSSGTTPSAISVSVDLSTLTPGTYTGTVLVQAVGGAPLQSVGVQLVVSAALPAQLLVQPSGFSFEGQTGGSNPPAQTLRISNTGAGTLNWTAQFTAVSGSNWLVLPVISGTASAAAPAVVPVTANTIGLTAGVYSGSLRVSSSTTGESKTLPATLLVSANAPTILLSQAGLSFTGIAGGSAVPAQSFGVLNSGQGALNWTVQASTLSGGSWLSVSPSTGSSVAGSLQVPMVQVGVNTTSMPAGQYSGIVTVSAPGASNSAQVATVTLTVLPAGSTPPIVVRPSGLIFVRQAGTSSPSSQDITLGTASNAVIEAKANPFTFNGGSWLSVATSDVTFSASQAGVIAVQPTLAALSAGSYFGFVPLGFSDGSSQTVNVLFVVTASAGPGTESLTSGGNAAGCSPQRLYLALRSLTSGFPTTVGYPTPIQVQLKDDCDNNVPDATAVASFSNGDSPVSLVSLQNGIYENTWRPTNPAGGSTITVRVTHALLGTAESRTVVQTGGTPPMADLFPGGVVNGASFASGSPLSPGSIISVFGSNMANDTAGAAGLPLPSTLAGATLNVAGQSVPLFYSSKGQINAQLPAELPLTFRPQIYVRVSSPGMEAISVPETITLSPVAPAIFLTGGSQGAILNTKYVLVDAGAPASAGDVVQVFATGLGPTQPPVPSGQAAPVPPALATIPVTATVGGVPATVQFTGLAPGFAGLYQVNVQIPSGVPLGSAIPLVLTQNGISSNVATLAIR